MMMMKTIPTIESATRGWTCERKYERARERARMRESKRKRQDEKVTERN
jgi:hypothetical protein